MPEPEKISQGLIKRTSEKPCLIVGIGASAGGVQAITALLEHINPDLGMAYVLILHLSPTHRSALAEIVQSKTSMPVQTVTDGMKVVADHVYVIPPSTFMTLADGHLKLAPRSITSVGNFAVDYFFTGLASVYRNNAIGIILSGTATDGTLGLKAIKAEGGITFAQDETAEFQGMPQHANNAGYVDFLLPPKSIADELARLAKVPYAVVPSEEIEWNQTISHHPEELKKILAIIKNKSGVDFFHHYKHASVYRRIMRRMALNKVDRQQDYYSMLQSSPKEVEALYDDLLINVTSFFRDPDFYRTLTSEAFPSITRQLRDLEPIRIWVAGCSTGEEAYSIAICLIEFMETNNLTMPVQIFASDLDAGAIEKARMGIYHVSALQGVTKDLLEKYFIKNESHYQIIKPVREICVFAQQNLLKDPPFSRMNLISCQNVLIYLGIAPQKKILHMFHYALKPSGYLFLGKSETIGAEEDLFEPLDKRIKLYSRKATVSPQMDFTFQKTGNAAVRESHAERASDPDPEKVISKLVLSRFVYPCIVVNKNLMITQFFGATSQYLEPVAGKASFNILKMIREELVVDLGSLLQQARKAEKNTRKEDIRISIGKEPKKITIEVMPIRTSTDIFFLVVFKEHAEIDPLSVNEVKPEGVNDQKDRTIIKLEEELIQSRGLIRSTNEEYETTYEELQANNEEILSSNEELQSVNEELETSKEELQSAVEELTTTNEELLKRNSELAASQKELKEVNEQLEQFAFISSHDLQEPLRKIQTFASLLASPKANLNPYSKKYTDKINASTSRMSSLLKDLHSFSILIHREGNFTMVDLNDTLQKVVKDFSVLIDQKKAVINIYLLPVIPAEAGQMYQLFRNLISNALKFNDGTPVVDVSAKDVTEDVFAANHELKPDRRYTSINIKDNGIGFDEMYLDKMFSLFQRLNDKKKMDGTGLGLAVCKKIVKNHEGSISAKSKISEGATFTVLLPMDRKVLT